MKTEHDIRAAFNEAARSWALERNIAIELIDGEATYSIGRADTFQFHEHKKEEEKREEQEKGEDSVKKLLHWREILDGINRAIDELNKELERLRKLIEESDKKLNALTTEQESLEQTINLQTEFMQQKTIERNSDGSLADHDMNLMLIAVLTQRGMDTDLSQYSDNELRDLVDENCHENKKEKEAVDQEIRQETGRNEELRDEHDEKSERKRVLQHIRDEHIRIDKGLSEEEKDAALESLYDQADLSKEDLKTLNKDLEKKSIKIYESALEESTKSLSSDMDAGLGSFMDKLGR